MLKFGSQGASCVVECFVIAIGLFGTHTHTPGAEGSVEGSGHSSGPSPSAQAVRDKKPRGFIRQLTSKVCSAGHDALQCVCVCVCVCVTQEPSIAYLTVF